MGTFLKLDKLKNLAVGLYLIWRDNNKAPLFATNEKFRTGFIMFLVFQPAEDSLVNKDPKLIPRLFKRRNDRLENLRPQFRI